MAIPEGYRLLTAEDVGKVFGKDLELVVHIDTSVTPNILNDTSAISNMFLTNFLWYNQWMNSSTGLATHVDYKIYSTYSGYVVNGTKVDGTVVTTNGRLTICDTSVFKLKELLLREWLTINSYYTDTNWNNFFYVKDINPKAQFISDMDGLAESIVNKAGSSGKKTIKEMKTLVDGLKTEFVTQEKTVTPTKSSQSVAPDSGKDGLSKVTVNAIPDEYIVPSGELEITENGTHDVTDKASVVVSVPSVVAEEWDGSYEEISSYYNVTLKKGSYSFYSITYSVDNGVSYNEATEDEVVQVPASVGKIIFNQTAGSVYTFYIDNANGVPVVQPTPCEVGVTEDMIIYISIAGMGGGN